jgi:hypothetical protein
MALPDPTDKPVVSGVKKKSHAANPRGRAKCRAYQLTACRLGKLPYLVAFLLASQTYVASFKLSSFLCLFRGVREAPLLRGSVPAPDCPVMECGDTVESQLIWALQH